MALSTAEVSRRWRQAHPDRAQARNARGRAKMLAADPTYYAVAAQKFRRNQPGLVWSHNARARALRKEAPVDERVHRLLVLEMSDGMCGICGEDVDPTNFAVDHIVSLSKGGWHGYDNVQAAHPRCNAAKH